MALAANCDLRIPVRVIREQEDKDSFSKRAFVYDGLYQVGISYIY